jgi:hypothetical protein
MKQYTVGDKVHITGKPEDVFTIAEVVCPNFYSLNEEEIAHFYLMKDNYENIYFGTDLVQVSI